MVMRNIDPYEPCPCGSGRKYKFCCKGKTSSNSGANGFPPFRLVPDLPEFDIDDSDIELIGDMDEGRKLCQKGLGFMADQKFKKAIPAFQKAHDAAPFVYTPANNMALCLLVTGQLDEAIRVQEESFEASPFENPFGLANLSIILFIKGDEPEAERCINEAITMKMPSADACVKVFDALAHFKRHKDILKVADASDYRDDPGVLFFTGVAAANLNNSERAQADLRRVHLGYHKADMAKRYLRDLKENRNPQTVLGDWPYLLLYEICPISAIKQESKTSEDSWNSRRIAASVCEGLLNELVATDPDAAMDMLMTAKHPDANALLWAIVNGTFGPDSMRTRAISILQERGLAKREDKIKIFLNGKHTEVLSMGTELNPDIVFGGELPPALDKLYTKAQKASAKKRPDWEGVGKIYRQIMIEAPDFYPAQYNYAISLLHRNRHDEALPILLNLYSEYPDYLFAPATILQIYTVRDRKKEADKLIKSVDLPEKTHPAAMTAWMLAQTMYHMSRNDHESARHCIDMAGQIAPDHPTVKMLARQLA